MMKLKNIKKSFSQELPFFMALPALLWQVLFLCIPLVVVVALSFTYLEAPGAWYRFSLAHYKDLFNAAHARVIMRSLALAFTTAVSCLLIAYPVAYFIALKIKHYKNFFLFLFTVPFWTNFLVLVYAWFFMLEYNGLVNNILMNMGIISEPLRIANSFFAISIVMIYCYLPFILMPLYSALEQFDPRLIESSFDLGATPWQTFYKIVLPASLPGIRTGFFLVFVPSFGEFAVPALLGGSKYMFVGSLISYYFLIARDIYLGAAFTCLSGVVLVLVSLGLRYLFKQRQPFDRLRIKRGIQ